MINNEKILCFEITPLSCSPNKCCKLILSADKVQCLEELSLDDEGEFLMTDYRFKPVYMTRLELNSLPEWDGDGFD